MTTTITGEIQEPNIELDILLTTAEGDDYDDNAGDDDGDNDDDDDDDDESNTCRPKPEEKLNEKPAKNENLEVVERKYHLSIFMIIMNHDYHHDDDSIFRSSVNTFTLRGKTNWSEI